MDISEDAGVPVGYSALIKNLKLNVLPHYRSSYIAMSGRGKTIANTHEEIHIYPKNYAIKNFDDPLLHIEFALKHDGINLHILYQTFLHIGVQTIEKFIQDQPTSKYARIIWYLYEWLTETKLNIEDCQSSNYVNLLDTNEYYTSVPLKKRRYRVNDNLLGNRTFCPIVRKTAALQKYENLALDQKAHELLEQYDPVIIARAGNYLYTKETKSSYEIEHEYPEQKRLAKFVTILKEASAINKLTKDKLIELQNTIVDPRYRDADYRHTQNYVGENIEHYRQKIHYISPKPEDVTDLMAGLLAALERMMASKSHPIVIAAAISFGFVFIHPFEDGNGRLHRFLIHYILSKQAFTPEGFIFPVSAVMLKNIKNYDQILELFSAPLLTLISNYTLDEKGTMNVAQDTKNYYQFIDYTAQVEYVFACIEETIATDFKNELKFVLNFDKTKRAIQNVVDMPDKKINLLIKLVIQNDGKLAEKKRKDYFSELTTNEIDEMANIIQRFML